jgi:hypothetical protein
METMRKILRWYRVVNRMAGYGLRWFLDRLRTSYLSTPHAFRPLHRNGPYNPVRSLPVETNVLRTVARRFLCHTFDILGSGWRDWIFGGHLAVNWANRHCSERVASELGAEYRPIDWHADRRAGYRFPANRWARLIQPGPRPGVDIKVPWELSRMQHLVPLALVAVDDETDPELAGRCEAEVFHQIRDFIAANPPRFGVNWRVAMDVAIRAANWVLAVSLLAENRRDISTHETLLGRSLREHGRFITAHLEWDPNVRGNHYLANVCGLAFIAAALPADDESDAWLAMATAEVIAEGVRQIHADGSGFEGSTAYHRLSLDMLVHTVALLRGIDAKRWRSVRACAARPPGLPSNFVAAPLEWQYDADGRPQPVLPDALLQRLWRAAAFTRTVTRPDGRALLIGDNDSGRFVKPCPRFEVLDAQRARARFPDRYIADGVTEEWREVGEDHTHILRAIDALFGVGDGASVDGWLVTWLASGRTLPVPDLDSGQEQDPSPGVTWPQPPDNVDRLTLTFPRRLDPDAIELHRYPGWGLYVLRGDGLLLSFRCGPLGLSGTGNHDHNDQLGVTLHLDGRDWIADPGTYRYTADPAERDAYRSVNAHFAPRLRDMIREPGSLKEGLWRLGDQAQARIEVVAPRVMQGSHRGYGVRVHRRVELFDDRVEISDWSDGDLDLLSLAEQFAALDDDGCALPFCPDYGVRCA